MLEVLKDSHCRPGDECDSYTTKRHICEENEYEYKTNQLSSNVVESTIMQMEENIQKPSYSIQMIRRRTVNSTVSMNDVS